MNWKIAALLTAGIVTGCKPQPAEEAAPAARAAPDTRQTVVFVGTSLTAGYGIGADLAFPAVIQEKIDSAGLPYRVINAGLSGETSAGGLRRIDWILQQEIDVLVIELGANDMLRALDPDSMKSNIDAIVRRAKEKYPKLSVVIAGMEAPPNLGARYTNRFRNAFRDVAAEHDAALVPFVLEGVAAETRLNQDDGIHPTAEGQRIMAGTVWRYLEPVLRARAGQR